MSYQNYLGNATIQTVLATNNQLLKNVAYPQHADIILVRVNLENNVVIL